MKALRWVSTLAWTVLVCGTVACSGGATGSSSGTAANDGGAGSDGGGSTVPTGAEIAKELFQSPDPSFDPAAFEGLYQANVLAGSDGIQPIRLRIAADGVSLAHKGADGTLVGAKAEAQVKKATDGSSSYVVTIIEASKGESPCPTKITTTISTGDVRFSFDGSGGIAVQGFSNPFRLAQSSCASSGSGQSAGADGMATSPSSFTKIGK